MNEKVNTLSQLSDALLPWFYKNSRDLPWRKDKEPYHIWLSEIMLQQTRVEAVKGYYDRFLAALPDIESLSCADDELLHKLWEGLGYYSRVRNLKKAAITIMEEHNGTFPQNYEAVRKLPGIGDYTAGAVCSIAFDQKTPAVDGNVLRVFSRLTNDSTPIDVPAMKKKTAEALQKVYPDRAGDFTQALMELGATVCGPNRKPDCKSCPCQDFCLGFYNNTAQDLPVKSAKKDRKQLDMTVLVLSCDGQYALEKRENKGLLAGLWQFPNTEGFLDVAQVIAFLKEKGICVKDVLRQTERKHIFTHIQWNMRCFYMEVSNRCEIYEWLPSQKIETEAALPTAFRMFWEEL